MITDTRATARAPKGPIQLSAGSWRAALKRVIAESRRDDITDKAAGLTYYGVLSIFPALLVVVSLVGLAGPQLTGSLINTLGQLMPGSVEQLLSSTIRRLQANPTSAGIAALVGVLLAVWSASGYVAAFIRSSNVIYDVPEGRSFWKITPIRVAVTLVALVFVSAGAFAVVLSGGIAQRVGAALGIGRAAVVIWNIAKWPALLLVASLVIALLYWASPNVKHGFRWVTPGGVLAVLLWVVASLAFGAYVANFGSYNRIYGSLAGVVIFLIWLWITNIALLLGVELNSELQRGRSIAAGHDEFEEPYVELRDTTKIRSSG